VTTSVYFVPAADLLPHWHHDLLAPTDVLVWAHEGLERTRAYHRRSIGQVQLEPTGRELLFPEHCPGRVETVSGFIRVSLLPSQQIIQAYPLLQHTEQVRPIHCKERR